MVTTPACHDQCLDNLNLLTRIHRSLGSNQKRVDIIHLNLNAKPPKHINLSAQPTLSLHRLYARQTDWIQPQSTVKTDLQHGRLFIVDPLGNAMLHYDIPIHAEGLRKDLSRVLRVSHVG